MLKDPLDRFTPVDSDAFRYPMGTMGGLCMATGGIGCLVGNPHGLIILWTAGSTLCATAIGIAVWLITGVVRTHRHTVEFWGDASRHARRFYDEWQKLPREMRVDLADVYRSCLRLVALYAETADEELYRRLTTYWTEMSQLVEEHHTAKAQLALAADVTDSELDWERIRNYRDAIKSVYSA
jgi:hypothetical protein